MTSSCELVRTTFEKVFDSACKLSTCFLVSLQERMLRQPDVRSAGRRAIGDVHALHVRSDTNEIGQRSLNSASNALTAWCIGCGETWTSPPNPFSNSRIIPTAPATASAHSVSVTADVKLGGANRPKLANSKVSQKTRRARNAFGVPCPTCWANCQRVSPILAASVRAWPSHHWSREFAGFNASIKSSSCWSSSYVDGLPSWTSAGLSGNRSI